MIRLISALILISLAFAARLVSLSPTITETVFMLGGGKQLVGVTRYCDTPVAAKRIPSVGGYLDVNEERLLSLKPDVVLLQKTHASAITFCAQHHLQYETFDVESLLGIRHMVDRLGVRLGNISRASEWLAQHPSQLAPPTTPTRSVLVILEQVVRNKRIEAAYVLGQESFYHPLLAASGFRSVYNGRQRYPLIGREGLQSFMPDVVIVLESGAAACYKGVWPASTKIVFFPAPVMKRPGPRYNEVLAAFKGI